MLSKNVNMYVMVADNHPHNSYIYIYLKALICTSKANTIVYDQLYLNK